LRIGYAYDEERREVTTESRTSRNELRRVGKFGVVGLLNTVIDFTLYNILSSTTFLTLVESNIISTSVAMVFSFFANRHVVFRAKQGSIKQQTVRFLLVTGFGIYVLQNGTIALLTQVWPGPMNDLVHLAITAGFHGHNAFIIKNGAKIVATLVSLIWNYIMYKRLVFL
jgi:putative flippase GtrA